MKLTKRIFIVLIAIAGIAASASAQFRFGPRVGVNVNSMRFDRSVFDGENRAGFTGGLQMEFTVPVVNLGFDASVMYVHRVNSTTVDKSGDQSLTSVSDQNSFKKRDYIEIPINLKWKIGLPVVGSIISPYIFTGPSFAFLTSKKAINEAYKNKSFDVAWNVGVGLQFFSHLQVGASYGFGLTKAIETVSNYQGTQIDGKNRYWTITAAWLF